MHEACLFFSYYLSFVFFFFWSSVSFSLILTLIIFSLWTHLLGICGCVRRVNFVLKHWSLPINLLDEAAETRDFAMTPAPDNFTMFSAIIYDRSFLYWCFSWDILYMKPKLLFITWMALYVVLRIWKYTNLWCHWRRCKKMHPDLQLRNPRSHIGGIRGSPTTLICMFIFQISVAVFVLLRMTILKFSVYFVLVS